MVVVLSLLSFLKIVFLGLESDNGIPKLLGFAGELVGVHSINIEGFDSDGEGDFLFLFQLFFGFGHLPACILDISAALHFSTTSLATFTCSLLLFFELASWLVSAFLLLRGVSFSLQPPWPSFRPPPCGASPPLPSSVGPISSLARRGSPCAWLAFP